MPLGPVLLRSGSTVVQHRQWVLAQDRRDPGAPGVPGARPWGKHLTAPAPRQPVCARSELGGHPVLVAGLGQRVTAHPHPPPRLVDEHDRILHRLLGAAGEHGRPRPSSEVVRPIGVHRLDPPMLRAGGSRRTGTAASRPTVPAARRDARMTPRRSRRGKPLTLARTSRRRWTGRPRPRHLGPRAVGAALDTPGG